jgi:hypothetical protein
VEPPGLSEILRFPEQDMVFWTGAIIDRSLFNTPYLFGDTQALTNTLRGKMKTWEHRLKG